MENHYTDEIESVLESIRINSVLLHQQHRLRFLQLKSKLKFYKIPIIIISSISSIVSLSQQYIDQNIITLLNMTLGLVCSIIGSIELFFGISNQLIKEHDTSKDYHILAMSIFKCLSLKRSDRPQNGVTFLENSYSNYVKLVENSCILPHDIMDKLCDIPDIPYIERQNMQREQEWERERNHDNIGLDLRALRNAPPSSPQQTPRLSPRLTPREIQNPYNGRDRNPNSYIIDIAHEDV